MQDPDAKLIKWLLTKEINHLTQNITKNDFIDLKIILLLPLKQLPVRFYS